MRCEVGGCRDNRILGATRTELNPDDSVSLGPLGLSRCGASLDPYEEYFGRPTLLTN
jgi:hypothetical protein